MAFKYLTAATTSIHLLSIHPVVEPLLDLRGPLNFTFLTYLQDTIMYVLHTSDLAIVLPISLRLTPPGTLTVTRNHKIETYLGYHS